MNFFFWTKVIDSKAAASADQRKEAAKQARENNAKVKKENKVITSLAAKAMPLLKPMVKRLTDLCAALEPKRPEMPQMTATLMDDTKKDVNSWLEKSQKILKDAGNGKTVGFEDFPFQTEKEMSAAFKTANEGLKAMAACKKSLCSKAN